MFLVKTFLEAQARDLIHDWELSARYRQPLAKSVTEKSSFSVRQQNEASI